MGKQKYIFLKLISFNQSLKKYFLNQKEKKVFLRANIEGKNLQTLMKKHVNKLELTKMKIKKIKTIIETPKILNKVIYKKQIKKLEYKVRNLKDNVLKLKKNIQPKKIIFFEE